MHPNDIIGAIAKSKEGPFTFTDQEPNEEFILERGLKYFNREELKSIVMKNPKIAPELSVYGRTEIDPNAKAGIGSAPVLSIVPVSWLNETEKTEFDSKVAVQEKKHKEKMEKMKK